MNRKFIGVFAILFIIVIFLLVFFSFEGNQKKFVELLDKLDNTEKEVIEVKNISGSNFQYINGRLFTFNGEKLTSMDMEENLLWQKTFLIPNLIFTNNTSKVCVYNKEVGEVYVYNTNGETLFELKLDKEIFLARLFEKGLSIHSKDESNDQITFYDYDGEIIKDLNYNDTFLVNYYMERDYIYTSEIIYKTNGFQSNFIKLENDNKSVELDLENQIPIRREKIGSNFIYLTDEGVIFTKG